MNKLIRIISVFSVIFLSQSSFACDYPTRLKMPNGSTAAKEDMLNAQKEVKLFVAAMEVYMECIVEEEKLALSAMGDLTPEVEKQREEMLNKKYNSAVDDMEVIAANFNSEVQAYKKAQ